MTRDVIISEITSIMEYIKDAKNKIESDHDKFQIALTNTLRLLDGSSSTLDRLKGDSEDLKGYLVKTSTDMRKSVLQPYDHLKTRMEKVLRLFQTT